MLLRRNFLAASAALALVGSWVRGVEANSTRSLSRIAFGSCAKQWKPQPLWYAIAAHNPDVFLFLGYAIYGDWHGKESSPQPPKVHFRYWVSLPAA